MTKGFYVVTTFEADNAALNEFNRLMRINKNVVRFLTIKQEA
jgi:small subunit ribosomal protein S6